MADRSQRGRPAATPEQTTRLGAALDALERHFGRGETYGRRDQQLILFGLVPEWVLRVARKHPDDHVRGHAANLVDQLEILRRECFAAVRYPGEGEAHGPEESALLRGSAKE